MRKSLMALIDGTMPADRCGMTSILKEMCNDRYSVCRVR